MAPSVAYFVTGVLREAVEPMSRGLRPVLDSIEFDGCPLCGERPTMSDVNGPDEIVLSCGHVIDARAWADEQFDRD